MTSRKLFALIATVAATAITIAILAPPESVAQGCAMCYQSASAAGPRAIQALRTGIIVLMVPPAFICIGITWLAWRRRNLHNQGS
jgi:hypothetical protein